MKKFLFRLTFVLFATMGVVVAVVLRDAVKAAREARGAYTVTSGRDVLVLGSSQVGCSFVEAGKFHNKVLWISQTVPDSCLARLLELERRSALDGVKTLMVFFNSQVYRTYSNGDVKYSMYQELPLAWGHPEVYDVSRLSLVAYMLENLRFPLHIHMVEQAPKDRPSVTEKSREDFVKFENEVVKRAEGFKMSENRGKRIKRLSRVYGEMKKVCDRHAIRFIVIEYGPYPLFEEKQPSFVKEDVASVLSNLRASGISCHKVRRYPKSYYCDYVHMTGVAPYQFTSDLYQDLGLQILKDND